LKSIQETFSLLLVSVNVIRGIPSSGSELVKVLGDTHPTLLEIEELIAHDFDEFGGNVDFVKLGLEGFPSHYLAFGLHGTDVLPPCTRCSG
jgi:hypothetical protein